MVMVDVGLMCSAHAIEKVHELCCWSHEVLTPYFSIAQLKVPPSLYSLPSSFLSQLAVFFLFSLHPNKFIRQPHPFISLKPQPNLGLSQQLPGCDCMHILLTPKVVAAFGHNACGFGTPCRRKEASISQDPNVIYSDVKLCHS